MFAYIWVHKFGFSVILNSWDSTCDAKSKCVFISTLKMLFDSVYSVKQHNNYTTTTS